jgi:large subunit ribosomal protein L21
LKKISLFSLSLVFIVHSTTTTTTRSPVPSSLSFFTSPSTTVQQKISRTTVSATPSSINQIGFQTPPSTGEKPSWDAIIEVGGSQQFVSEGRYYECHSLPGLEPGSKVAFERVLATRDTDKPTFGQPYVKGARVEATVLENYKDEKVIVFKYRPKKHYRRKNGHRQHMTRFLVTKVIKA